MKLAFVSYEYPPETGGGGIGTYLINAVGMLTARGHSVHVFAGAGDSEERTSVHGTMTISRIGRDIKMFMDDFPKVFNHFHEEHQFDALEVPEYFNQARFLTTDVPRIVKLHTPSCVVSEINSEGFSPTLAMQSRRVLGALRRFQRPTLLKGDASTEELRMKNEQESSEAGATRAADLVVAPCHAIAEMLSNRWKLDPTHIDVFPNPFEPTPDLLHVSCDTQSGNVTFIGRLEPRKGILELVDAIPMVLKAFPNIRFRMVGTPHPALDGRGTMVDYLRRRFPKSAAAMDFVGSIGWEELPSEFSMADLCVFPSRWENFPNVVLEAMSAARAIVGSCHGGMSEQLDGGKCGLIVDPQKPFELAQAIIKLLQNPTLRRQLGLAARERVLSEYSADRLAPIYERAIEQAIQNHAAKQKAAKN